MILEELMSIPRKSKFLFEIVKYILLINEFAILDQNPSFYETKMAGPK